MNNNNIGANMLLINSQHIVEDPQSKNKFPVKTFRIISLTKECPYVEGMYDPTQDLLVLVDKTIKETAQFLPKIDDNGDFVRHPKATKDNLYKLERRIMQTFSELYVQGTDAIEEFIKLFAINAESFDTKQYFKFSEALLNPPSSIQTNPSDIIIPGQPVEGVKLDLVKG